MRGQQRFATIRTEGGLLPADLLARIAEGDKALESLDPTGYHLAPGERLNEAASRSWNRLLGAWESFAAALADAPASDRTTTALTRNRWSQVLFQELGYGQLQTAKAIAVDGKEYPVSHLWGAVPVHLVGARVELDRRTSGVAGAARMSPHGLVQELLNRSDAYLWGFVSNGLRLRLLRDNVSLTRQAFVEFDLEAMLTGQAYADFVVLWLLCHQSRVEGDIPEKCLLERWSLDAAQRGTRALDQLRGAVESAIATMGEGFLAHPANGDLRDRLRSGDLDRQDYYRQLLRLVYRLLFVSVAEARDVLNDPAADPAAKERYHRFYSLERIRDLAETRRGGHHGDLWAQLQLVFRALGDDAGCPELALPSLGSFLWSADATPDLDQSQLANRHLLAAVRTLSSTREGKVTRTVDYRNLGSEELGSVYESLLELHPELNVDARTFSLSTASGHERKTTGSYYTPTSLIKELLDSALDPVLAEAANTPDPEAAILDLKVLDPACGSGHFLIAAAHRVARRLAAIRSGEEESSPDSLRTALRDVVGRCIYGIDVNPMAVELCKVGLWMEALEPGKPLSFLEHRIACGNSLLGATPALLARGIPNEAFVALEGDDKSVIADLKRRNKRERGGQQTLALDSNPVHAAVLARAVRELDNLPDTALADIAEKQRHYAMLKASREAEEARLAADAWCAAFVLPKRAESPFLTHAIWQSLCTDPASAPIALVKAIQGMREEYNFFHPHLAFPQVLHGAVGAIESGNQAGWEGGFDVVLGNPPWDQVQYDPQEVFAVTYPEIANATTMSKRSKLIAALADEDPKVYADYLAGLRSVEAFQHFVHSSGLYPLTSFGRLNTAPLFAEQMRTYISSSGRLGIIVPMGIATDSFNQRFFADLVEGGSLVSLLGFENEARIFPEVHNQTKFCLLTLAGPKRRQMTSEFAFFARRTSDLSIPGRTFALSGTDLRLLNPNTHTCPTFRWARDAELTKAVYGRLPILIRDEPEENPWDLRFQLMFMMNSDSHLFQSAADCEAEGARLDGNAFILDETHRWLPLYEAKMVHQWNHRFGTYDGQTQAQANKGVLPRLTAADLDDCERLPLPRFWVSEAEVDARLARRRISRWLLGFRDVARSVDERTVIPTVLPRVAVGHSCPLLFSGHVHAPLLIANLSSFVFDYLCRQKQAGAHLNFFVLKQLPVLLPDSYDAPASWAREPLAGWLRPYVLELAYTAWDVEAFAADLGWTAPPFRWSGSRRELLKAELDAAFFHLYGIDRDDADYIMDTFPVVRRRDELAHGEYRTKRLILECYDAMADAIAAGKPYQTLLDPPPAHPSVAHPARH